MCLEDLLWLKLHAEYTFVQKQETENFQTTN